MEIVQSTPQVLKSESPARGQLETAAEITLRTDRMQKTQLSLRNRCGKSRFAGLA